MKSQAAVTQAATLISTIKERRGKVAIGPREKP